MKYLLISLLITFTACTKQKCCYQCTSDTYVSPNPFNAPYQRSERTYCDITEDEMQEYAGTSTSTVGGTTYTTVTNCVCQ